MLAIPDAFAASTVAREGDAGRQWLAELPERVATVCAAWELTLDGATMHGYLGIVVPVRRGRERCVLKVSWPDRATTYEAAALRAWDGRGAVRLLAALPDHNALLLERLDPRRSLQQCGVDEALPIAGALLRRLAIPAPPGIPSQESLTAQIRATLEARWRSAGRPMSRSVIERVLAIIDGRGRTAERLLVNYDLHDADVLAGVRESKDLAKKAGLPVNIMSGGSTGTYNIDHETGLTELEAGTYVFMDTEYFIVGGKDGNMKRYTDWQPALTVLTTVDSQHHPNIITTDYGNKALAKATDEVKDMPWLQVGVQGAEYGALRWKDGDQVPKLGDRIEIYCTNLDQSTNAFDRYYITQGDKVVDVWPIMGRSGAAQR